MSGIGPLVRATGRATAPRFASKLADDEAARNLHNARQDVALAIAALTAPGSCRARMRCDQDAVDACLRIADQLGTLRDQLRGREP